MRSTLFELKQERAEALESCEKILARAEADNRELTASENSLYKEHLDAAQKLNPRIEKIESVNTLSRIPREQLMPGGAGSPDAPPHNPN